jgi:pimeloyl-ACP methyl ester carboxylesterase
MAKPDIRESKRLHIDGIWLAYVEAGPMDAEPIVLLHGYIGSHRTWRHQIEPLAARHRVLAFDWFGWGASGRNLELDYDFDSEVDRLRRVLDAAGAESCNVFGFDYGGLLSLGLTQRHPERVRRLALLNSRAHRAFTVRMNATFGLITTASQSAPLGALLARMPLTAAHRSAVRYELKHGIFDRELLDEYIGWMSDDPEGGRWWVHFFRGYRVRSRPELAQNLGRIACPTAIIWGRDDPWIPEKTAHELGAMIPEAQLTLLDARHFAVEERPREVLAALENLLQRS